METPITKHFIIHEYSHSFEIRNPTLFVSEYINQYMFRYRIIGFATEKQKKENVVPERCFIISRQPFFYRMHIGHMKELLEFLSDKGYPEGKYEHFKYGLGDSVKCDILPTTSKQPRGKQQEAIDFVVSGPASHSKLLQMPTGTGKTFVSLSCAVKLGVRTAIIVGGGYVDKWIADVQSNTSTNADEIYVVKGGTSLLKLLHSTREEIAHIKFIIYSLETLNVFFKAYEANDGKVQDTPYPYPPEVMYTHLGIGFVIYDEIHESIISVYRTLAYTHVQLVLGLSATFTSLQESILELQKLLFPLVARYDDIKMNRYINLIPISYQFNNFGRLNVQTRNYGMSTYSHTAYEQWLLKRPGILKNYLIMIGYTMHHLFNGNNDKYVKGDRAIVFASTVDMVDKIHAYIKEQYPDLDVRRYVGVDPYENLMQADICITTPGSGGTAVDIPGLTFVLQTVAIQSPVQNLQSLGRLREIDGREVKYSYLFCSQIQNHKAYHFQRLKLFGQKIKGSTELIIPFNL